MLIDDKAKRITDAVLRLSEEEFEEWLIDCRKVPMRHKFFTVGLVRPPGGFPMKNAAHLPRTPRLVWGCQVAPWPDVALPAFERGIDVDLAITRHCRRLMDEDKFEVKP
jgi:hypothetical protein